MRKKSNPVLAETILKLKKINPQMAQMMTLPRRKMIHINVEQLSRACKDGDKILVPGKILGSGSLDKKLKVVAFSASEEAMEKIKKAKGEFVEILDEVKKNPKLNELKMVI